MARRYRRWPFPLVFIATAAIVLINIGTDPALRRRRNAQKRKATVVHRNGASAAPCVSANAMALVRALRMA